MRSHQLSDTGYGSQAKPKKTDEPSVHDLVVQDLEKRKDFGFKKYGAYLQASNGRDHLQDAYEEALDLCCYLRAAIARRVV